MPRVNQRADDAERGHGFHRGRDHFLRLPPAHREAEHLQIRVVEARRLVVFARVRLHHADAREGLLHHHHEHAGLILLARAGLAHLAADEQHREQAEREDGEREQREARIDTEERHQRREDRDRLLHQIARDLRQRALRHARLVEDRLHQFARLGAIEKLQRLAEQMAEERLADVVEHPLADPEHAVGIEVGEDAAHRHEQRDARADQRHFPQRGLPRLDLGKMNRNPRREGQRRALPVGENDRHHHPDEHDQRAIRDPEERPEKHAEEESRAVGLEVARQPHVRLAAHPHEFAEGHLRDVFAGDFFSGHQIGRSESAFARSTSVARITTSVEMRSIGAPFMRGWKFVTGASGWAAEMTAARSWRGRQ